MSVLDVEHAVRGRYAKGAQARVSDLCCPTNYDAKFLEAIPREVLQRDYGCGDPSRHLREGETVLDLGSGTGKICFIAAQVVGPTGWVIGVDMTPEMLEVARRNAPIVADRLGFANVVFREGRIQDLEPIVESESVDVVVSNCVLNLVDTDSRQKLFSELHRVLRDSGRAVISDIVSDEDVPLEMQQDPELWSGCISGAFTESGFLDAFGAAGFHSVRVLERQAEPWRTVGGIDFRSVTLEAFKDAEGASRVADVDATATCCQPGASS